MWTTQNGRKVLSKRATARRDKAIILTMVDCGLRASEFCSLAIGDYDAKRGRIFIKYAKDWRLNNSVISVKVPLVVKAKSMSCLIAIPKRNKKRVVYLGRDTAIHALVAGRTGSGKSTLLHTLITSLTIKYSPDELHLYLIDFKKGVEFKTYAVHCLPHAQVIAIESEWEFGLSVLEGLDAELINRGELFRKAGVDDLAAYRLRNGTPLPRLLLLVDEFQEFGKVH